MLKICVDLRFIFINVATRGRYSGFNINIYLIQFLYPFKMYFSDPEHPQEASPLSYSAPPWRNDS